MSSSMYRKRRNLALTACSRNGAPALTACSRKRRGRTVIAAAATLESEASSCSSLSGDLIHLIGCQVLAGDLLDYIRFRAVCPHWRSSTLCPRGRGVSDRRFHPHQWMMVPEGHGIHPGHSKLHGYIRFFNLSTGVFVRAKLPLFRDHCILDWVDGLLLLQRDHDTAVRLLNPFTGDIAELPPVSTLRRGLEDSMVDWSLHRRISATSVSVSTDGVVVIMIAFYHLSRVAFASTGDQQWRYSSWTISHFWRPSSFQGKIYTLHCSTHPRDLHIFRIDPPQHKVISGLSPWPEPELIATCPASNIKTLFHLAECNSEILVIGFSDRQTSDMVVYRLADIMRDRIVRVTSIGGNALFVDERVLSVGSRVLPAATIVGDSIVRIHPTEKYLGQYHLGSGTWLPTADGCVINGVPSPCSPVYYIYTCCNRFIWNKGKLLFQGNYLPVWKVKRKWRVGAEIAKTSKKTDR